MAVEFELKYRATEQLLEQVSEALDGPKTHLQMQTTYYDTDDGGFSARHCTLRRRLENGRAVCTLKTPAGAYGRQEYELEDVTIEQAVQTLCSQSGDAGLMALSRRPLTAVCGARFHRVAVQLQLHGCTAEVAMDTGVLMGGAKEMPLTELELELKSGDEQALLAFAAELASRFSLVEEPASKFRRALALAKGEII